MSDTFFRDKMHAAIYNFQGFMQENRPLFHDIKNFQHGSIREFVREVNHRIDTQRIGAPEAIRDTLKELGIEL